MGPERKQGEKIMATIISSQNYTDEDIVARKIEDEDFVVMLSPEFEYDGRIFQVVLDGHHSYAAAIEAGVEPEFFTATAQDCDYIGYLANGDIESFLDNAHLGNDWYDISTGNTIW